MGSEKAGKDLERILIYINISGVFYIEETSESEGWRMKQKLKGAIETMSIDALAILIPTLYFWAVISNSCVWMGGGEVVVGDH